jgi:hypothetical protein
VWAAWQATDSGYCIVQSLESASTVWTLTISFPDKLTDFLGIFEV